MKQKIKHILYIALACSLTPLNASHNNPPSANQQRQNLHMSEEKLKSLFYQYLGQGHATVVEKILSVYPHFAQIKINGAILPILYAVSQGYLEVVKVMVDKNNELIHHKDNDGNNIVQKGISRESLAMVNYLITKKTALLQEQNNRQATPFHTAATLPSTEGALIFLTLYNKFITLYPKIDPLSASNHANMTPLNLMVDALNPAFLNFLLSKNNPHQKFKTRISQTLSLSFLQNRNPLIEKALKDDENILPRITFIYQKGLSLIEHQTKKATVYLFLFDNKASWVPHTTERYHWKVYQLEITTFQGLQKFGVSLNTRKMNTQIILKKLFDVKAITQELTPYVSQCSLIRKLEWDMEPQEADLELYNQNLAKANQEALTLQKNITAKYIQKHFKQAYIPASILTLMLLFKGSFWCRG